MFVAKPAPNTIYLNIEVFPGKATGDVGRHAQSNQRTSSLLHLPRKNLLQAKLILGTSCQSSTRVPGGGQKLPETGLLSNSVQGHGNVADEGT